MPTPLDAKLYEKAKEEADNLYSKPSAYKSGYIVKKYKELGGRYADDNQERNLDRWFSENWKNIGGNGYPVYRPTKRINKDTPLLVNEIDPANLRRQIMLKRIIKGKKNLPAFLAKTP
jgi:hypothetical protein